MVIRLALLFLIPVPEPSSDANWYLKRAITLAEQDTYSDGGILTAYWPVGYPAFLALLFKATGPSLLAARLANLVLAAASFWLLYAVARRFLQDELTARGAILLMTIYPNNAAYVPLLLTETLYTFLLLGGSLLLLLRQNWINTMAVGGVFGLATLVKTQTILLIPLLAFLAFLGEWSIKNALRAAIRAGVVLCMALVVVAPWTLRNYSIFGTFVLVSTNGGIALLAGNNPSAVGDYRTDYSDKDPLFARAQYSVEDQIRAERRARSLAYDWIKHNPGQFLGLIPKKVFRLWAPDGEAEWSYTGSPFYRDHSRWFRFARVANQAFYVLMLFVFLMALWKLLKIRPTPIAFFGIGVVLVLTLISVIFSGQSRYHFPAMPFILAYAAWVLLGPGGHRRDPQHDIATGCA